MQEHLLNPALRRVDWRFLLPCESIGRAVCFGDAALASSVQLVAQELVAAANAREGEIDLVVAVNPDADTLSRMRALLRPGGAMYCEWSSRDASPQRIAGDIERCGLVGLHLYHAYPSLQQCASWVPLRGAKALAYAARVSVGMDRRFSQLVRDGMKRAATGVAMSAGSVRPICAIAQAPHAGHASTGEPAFIRVLKARGVAVSAARGPSDARWMLITTGPRSISKVIAVVFDDAGASAASVVKMARVPGSVPGLRREAAALTTLWDQHAGATYAAPQLIASNDGTLPFVAESAVPGVPMFRSINRINYHSLAMTVTQWLRELAASRVSTAENAWDRIMRPVFDDFVRSFEPVLDADLVRESRAMLERTGVLPIVMEHRDPGPWNLFVGRDNRVHVLDWESSEPRGLPALDLIYFLTQMELFHANAFRDRTEMVTYREANRPETLHGATRYECTELYCMATQLDPTLIPALRVFAWMLHARSEYAAFTGDAAGTPSPDALNRSLFLRLWREELAIQREGR